LIFAASAAAQNFVFKPYYGYLLPRMTDVNEQIDRQMQGWRELLAAPIPFPDKIDGDRLIGAQILYHFSEDYAAGLDISQYQEKVATEYSKPATATPERFFYEREVQAVNVALNLKYYFGYYAADRLNAYIGAGTGVIFVKANSTTQSSFITDGSGEVGLQPVDTRGKFSGESLMATTAAGFDFQLTDFFAFSAEIGYQFANVGQLEGTVNLIDNPDDTAFTTNTSFDFSGFYFHAGLGIGLPF
jgi:opacity protein-like surface antigen